MCRYVCGCPQFLYDVCGIKLGYDCSLCVLISFSITEQVSGSVSDLRLENIGSQFLLTEVLYRMPIRPCIL